MRKIFYTLMSTLSAIVLAGSYYFSLQQSELQPASAVAADPTTSTETGTQPATPEPSSSPTEVTQSPSAPERPRSGTIMNDSPTRIVRTASLMGTVVSAHVIVATPGSEVEALIDANAEAAFAKILEIERIFSTFRPDSDISRLRDGTLLPEAASPLVEEVRRACTAAESMTRGRFSAHWLGWFDPTGYVKGWAIEEAFSQHLRPLLATPGVIAPLLSDADLWATAALVAGAGDLSWIADAATTSGLVIGADGRMRRWSGSVELSSVASDAADSAATRLTLAGV